MSPREDSEAGWVSLVPMRNRDSCALATVGQKVLTVAVASSGSHSGTVHPCPGSSKCVIFKLWGLKSTAQKERGLDIRKTDL